MWCTALKGSCDPKGLGRGARFRWSRLENVQVVCFLHVHEWTWVQSLVERFVAQDCVQVFASGTFIDPSTARSVAKLD